MQREKEAEGGRSWYCALSLSCSHAMFLFNVVYDEVVGNEKEIPVMRNQKIIRAWEKENKRSLHAFRGVIFLSGVILFHFTCV